MELSAMDEVIQSVIDNPLPPPTFTEKTLPSQAGKVFIVTGGNSGIGFELVKILYAAGGVVYMAGRDATSMVAAIETIKSTTTPGNADAKVKSLLVDLGDLSTIESCVSTFLAQESRLDVLWNNAGVAQIPAGTVTTQSHEIHMGINCLGAFLLTSLLLPTLRQTALTAPAASVRVVFTSSGIIDLTPVPGGLSLTELMRGNFSQDASRNYTASKAGNWLLASEFHKRVEADGIVCLVQNPGLNSTKGWDKVPMMKSIFAPVLENPIMGAYTELWAGLSPEVKIEDGGRYAEPWGRWHASPREDVLESLKTKAEGGTGLAAEFWDWCEAQTKMFAHSS